MMPNKTNKKKGIKKDMFGEKPEVNVHGLPRYIPAEIKFKVREACGFGCVCCGSSLCHYEHVDPLFVDAKVHDPTKIVLLCGGCHDRVNRGHLSKESVKRSALNPKCKQLGFSRNALDITDRLPNVIFGKLRFINVQFPIKIAMDNIFWFKSPEVEGADYRLNAYLADQNGKEILKIVDNECVSPVTHWDMVIEGPKTTIRSEKYKFLLVLKTELPNTIIIERLKMAHKGNIIDFSNSKDITLTTSSGLKFAAENVEVRDSIFGLLIYESSILMGVMGGSVTVDGGGLGWKKLPV